ncbi:hypothetical protein MKZ38_010727 [Zalerion maritima]|uniref:Transmembrane protein n=1 Tax=Zalerion maritima TaxID=339359 RepID=A0AAD5RFI4_9PEZI|nr:hypothetical protein MKZ38_010727 [Zalerion maritima]
MAMDMVKRKPRRPKTWTFFLPARLRSHFEFHPLTRELAVVTAMLLLIALLVFFVTHLPACIFRRIRTALVLYLAFVLAVAIALGTPTAQPPEEALEYFDGKREDVDVENGRMKESLKPQRKKPEVNFR